MKTSELLSELQENLLRDVSSEAVDSSPDSLWTPEALVRYLNDAQNRMARQSECLRDGDTPEITRLYLVEDLHTYEIDSRINRVLSVMIDGDRFLKETSLYHEYDGTSSRREETPIQRPNPNRVTRYSLGVGEDRIRVYPTPNADEAGSLLTLQVSRLPLYPLEHSELDREPEVPEDFQLDLVEWAAFRALRNHDVDGENLQKANVHRAAFNRAVDELRRQVRHKHAPPAAFGGRVHN